MLDASLKTQLQAYLERLTRPVHLVASLDDGDSSAQMLQLLQDIEALSPKVSLEVRRDDAQREEILGACPRQRLQRGQAERLMRARRQRDVGAGEQVRHRAPFADVAEEGDR